MNGKVITKELVSNTAQSSVIELEELFRDKKEIALFFSVWLQCNRNATLAYQKLHPQASYGSCRTLGARQLAKVDTSVILAAYGLGYEQYFEQLHDGLTATRVNPYTFKIEPDHKTRRMYHRVLGKLLDVEQKAKEISMPRVQYESPSWWESINNGNVTG